MLRKDVFTEEQNAIGDMVNKFVDNEIMPVRQELESDPKLVESIHQKLVDLGIQKAGYPPEYGGTGPGSPTTLGIVCEELARGDAGISLSCGINAGFVLHAAMVAGNKAVLDEFIPPFCGDKINSACLSMTDATGGADTENPLLKGRGIKTRAFLDGDEWVINGSKSWPTHAGISSVYLTVCNTDYEQGEEGIALIFVPDGTPGLSFGQPEAKMGFQTSVNASVFYDNVRVPKDFRLAGPGPDAQFYYATMAGTQWHSSVIALGIMRAVFEIILDYTQGRESGGKPIREWSLVAGILADMAIRLEMTRGAVYNYAYMMEHPEIYGPPFTNDMVAKASIVRSYASDSVVWIANKAIELMGSNGLSPEYHLEKYLRDSKITQIWLGGQQVSKYRIARGYYDYSVY